MRCVAFELFLAWIEKTRFHHSFSPLQENIITMKTQTSHFNPRKNDAAPQTLSHFES